MPKTTLDYMLEDGGFMDVARGLHWYCVDHHEGQNSALYSIQCQLGYSPGRADNGYLWDTEDITADDTYAMLRDGEFDAQELLEAIQTAQEAHNG